MNDSNGWERASQGNSAGGQAGPSFMQDGPPRGELVELAWRYRWLMAAVMGASIVVALVYLHKAMPSYTATSRIYVQQDGPKVVNEFKGIITDQSKNFLYTQCEVLRSTPIIIGALDKPGIRQLKTLRASSNPVARIRSGLSAKVGTRDDIIDVCYDSPYVDEGVKIVNAIVEAYIGYNASQKQSTAAEVLKILRVEKERRDKELAVKLEAMIAFRRENGLLNPGNDTNSIVTQDLVTLSGALTQAQLQLVEATAAYSTAKAMVDNPVMIADREGPALIHGGIEDAQLSTDIQRVQQRLATLKRDYTDEHPAVQNARNELTVLKRQYMAIVKQRLDKSSRKVAEIQGLVDKQQELAKRSGVMSATYAMLDAEVKRTEKLCDILDNRIKELSVSEDTAALNISVLEKARREDVTLNNMKRARVMALALVLGAALSLGMALGHDKLDQRLKSADEITRVTGAPVLGVVPSVLGHLSRAVQGQIVHVEPASRAAEAYRSIRTAVYFGLGDDDCNRLLVTSPVYGEGKTTVASNLAIAMAESGQHTLIVDADFRKPAQQTVFQAKGEHGLSSVLSGTVALSDAIVGTTHKNLDVLPCGMIPPNPTDMLNSMAFLDVLEKVSQKYDRVIIDSPPIIPVADARIIGAMCKEALVVVRADKSTRKVTDKACEELRNVGASILGVVVNGVAKNKDSYGYFHDRASRANEEDAVAKG